MNLERFDLFHFPEKDDCEDAPREPYIRLKALHKTQLYKREENDKGEKVNVKDKVTEEYRNYYYPIGSGRYDTLSMTGIPAILKTVKKREAKGHEVTGFGNFPKTVYYQKLASSLMSDTLLRLQNENDPVRKRMEIELREEIETKLRAEMQANTKGEPDAKTESRLAKDIARKSPSRS